MNEEEEEEQEQVWTAESAMNDLKINYPNLRSKIAFAPPRRIFSHYKGALSLEAIKAYLRTVRTYASLYEYKSSRVNPIFKYT